LLAPKSAKWRKISREFELTVGQGYPRALILVSIEKACDFLLVINSNFGQWTVTPTVFETLTFKARKWLVFPTYPLFDDPALGAR